MIRPLTGAPRLGFRAAAVLVDEFVRQSGPKNAVLVGVEPDSPVLTEAINALLPGDTLTVVADHALAGTVDESALTERIAAEGSWVAQRVTVVPTPADAKPADAVLVGRPLAGDELLPMTSTLHDIVTPGGSLCLASLAFPGRRNPDLPGEVVTDLVLLNRPPVRVHRLRRSPMDTVTAERVEPAFRPSSVPLTGQWRIDSNGVAVGAICLGAAAALKWLRPHSRLWLLPVVAAAPTAAFFRDPERIPPVDPQTVVSAADGKVLAVEELTDHRFRATDVSEWLRISVFLSVLDVHINRSPVAGRVTEVIREDGGYAPAMNPAAEHNVAAYTVLDTGRGPVVVAQRTGLVARRIVHRARPGTLLARGERYGLIRFGSRTDVYLPVADAEPLVAPGDRVTGGESVIARWR
ncbi:MAG TPA: phosphatidylserine decarboxylase [Micromonosporaceae bacterium]|jgi:phosphatidylserine decarboxylase|nr:phosphatidylserine decarboxylase [Micromonosporaceae bacterium]